MGKDSEIEWTHHTFNPWWGCSKVSAACSNCYAEAWAKRVGQKVWGSESQRRFFGAKHWAEPFSWNAEAEKLGVRRRVFCASMGDVFERRSDLNCERSKLWELIKETPALDWLLLTKRPQNIARMVPWKEEWPQNVWIGTTVENQAWANRRLPYLLSLPAKVRFLSCEPLLGEIDLSSWINQPGLFPINWVIAGGESGHHSRPMQLDWVRGLRDMCDQQGIAFHFKQWGHWIPEEQLRDRNGKRMPVEEIVTSRMIAMGKKEAGRVLDGRTHDSFPFASAA